MIREFNRELQQGANGEKRNFTIRHTLHGDVRLDFWQGKTKPSLTDAFLQDKENPYPIYNLSHTTEDFLMASLMGYLARIKASKSDEIAIFSNAIDIIGIGNSEDGEWVPTRLEIIADGTPDPWYDIPERGWYSLTGPLVPQPGVRLIGGTALYTTPTEELVIAYISDENNEGFTVPEEHATHLTKNDLNPIATAIAEISLGESVENLKNLFALRFGNK